MARAHWLSFGITHSEFSTGSKNICTMYFAISTSRLRE